MTVKAPTSRSIVARHYARRLRRGPRRRNEGAVMLVVMLILMIATAGAAISVQSTASELHAAGQERIGLQARYTSEAAMMTTIAWVDKLGDSNQWLEIWEFWAKQPAPPPTLPNYAEPAVPLTARHHASRTTMLQQLALSAPGEIPPLSMAAASGTGGSSGSGGTGTGGGSAVFVDNVGSFGPRQAYGPQPEGYVVDINDCALAPSGLMPGAPVGGGPGSLKISQFYCVLTAHVRIELPGAGSGIVDEWEFGNIAFKYTRDRFTNDHDSRATILTPQMLVAGE